MGPVIESDFLPLRKSFHTNSLKSLSLRDVLPVTAGQMSCRRKQWFSPGVNKRTKVGEWMIKIWLHKAINTSVIAVFFWNKPRFCPILLRLCHSFLIPAHALTALLLPQCHHCHLPTTPRVQQGWLKAQANKPRRADSLAGVQVAAHLLAPMMPSTNSGVWGFLGVSICKQGGFELNPENKWKNRHKDSGERFVASWVVVGRDYNGLNNHKTSYWRLKKFQGVNIVKQLMYLIWNGKRCQEFNLGEHNFSSLFLFLNFAPLFYLLYRKLK